MIENYFIKSMLFVCILFLIYIVLALFNKKGIFREYKKLVADKSESVIKIHDKKRLSQLTTAYVLDVEGKRFLLVEVSRTAVNVTRLD